MTQPAAAPHPGEGRGTCQPEAGNGEKVPSYQWRWPLQASASKAGRCLLAGMGSKSLTLELTKFMEKVVGDGCDCSRDLSSVVVEIPSSFMQGRRGTDDYRHDTSDRGTSTGELQCAAAGKLAVPDQATARSANAGRHLNPPGGGRPLKAMKKHFRNDSEMSQIHPFFSSIQS